ncbi:uncharacterized protein A4U43_C06F4880 [Asparagus officinalis]|uniref:WRC domain-containing protein n=2 Tax=Asparagus officinalis TaxID=4686 RepID=A0A5P1EKG0_ASPOF|nr:uncharacterized protein A4U43_C06F4880 [Asparagus officinalis]
MRIRRRTQLPLSLSQTPTFSLQIQPPDRSDERGLHPNGDPSVALQLDPRLKQVSKEEKDAPSSSSHKKALDTQVHNNERMKEAKVESIDNTTRTNALNNSSTTASNTSGKNDTNGKKRRSPAVLMEGSRCSRVNGRGWQCSQQTLIGYSLCEHHLGKGRIRSINNGGVGGGRQEKNNIRKTKKKEISSLLDDSDVALV